VRQRVPGQVRGARDGLVERALLLEGPVRLRAVLLSVRLDLKTEAAEVGHGGQSVRPQPVMFRPLALFGCLR
jgi:hypothetical protein